MHFLHPRVATRSTTDHLHTFQDFHADFAHTEPWPESAPVSTSDVETIRSEAVLLEEQARSHTTSGSTATEPAWHGMPQFNLDQRARATSFNPFAAPFVPPPVYPAPFASQPQQQQQQPPPASVPNGFGLAFGPIAPLALPAAPPFAHADIRYQPLAEMLRQALHENGVLHHKVVKYDQVHKADHGRLHQLTCELEELKQQSARIRNEPRLDPVQQKQIFDLEQAISRQNTELARLQRERDASRKVAQQADDEREAAAKRHEDEVTHENRRWKVALQMREERINVLQAEVCSGEQTLAKLKADHAAVDATSDARLKETKRNDSDALEAARLELSQTQEDLRILQSRFGNAQADAACTSAELRASIDQRDELERKLAAREKEREERQTQEADWERLRTEYADLQRRYDGQKEVIETQSRNLKEAVVQKGTASFRFRRALSYASNGLTFSEQKRCRPNWRPLPQTSPTQSSLVIASLLSFARPIRPRRKASASIAPSLTRFSKEWESPMKG